VAEFRKKTLDKRRKRSSLNQLSLSRERWLRKKVVTFFQDKNRMTPSVCRPGCHQP